MKLSPEEAIDLVNADIAKAFANPVLKKSVETAVTKFVQASLDAFVERGHLDVKLQFDLDFDPKKKSFFVSLSGTF